jgi:polyhydroxybutyrate depolymerase
VPFTGSPNDGSQLAQFRSVDDTIAAWASADGCPKPPVVEAIPDVARDGLKVTKTTYGPGKEGSEVVLYVVDGGGHTWPGLPSPVGFLGKSTKNISANDLIWEFFKKHPMK